MTFLTIKSIISYSLCASQCRAWSLEKRLREVRDRLRDVVTEHGHFVDEDRGVAVDVEPRFRKGYDAERLVAVFPRLAGCVKSAVDTGQLEACLRAGIVTDTELERTVRSQLCP